MKGWSTVAVAMLLAAPSAFAQGVPAAPADAAPQASQGVPEATLRAVKYHRVTLTTSDGEVTGRVLAAEPDSITLARDDGEVITIARAQVLRVRLTDVAPPSPPPASPTLEEAPPAAPQQPTPEWHNFGVHLGIAAGVALDGDYKNFHTFVSTSFLFPLVSSGDLFAFTAGAGASFALSPSWRIDLFGHVAPLFWKGVTSYNQTSTFVGVGVGIGFRYVSANGWCLGVKLPLLGAAPGDYPAYNSSVGVVAAYYYIASGVSLPVFSVGWRL